MSANGYTVENVLKKGTAQVIGASETSTVVSEVFRMSAEDSKFCLIRLDTNTVTVTNAVTADLQHSWDGGTTWEDVGTGAQVAIAGNNTYQIEMDYAAANTSLVWPLARVVINSGVGDAATVAAIYVTRRL